MYPSNAHIDAVTARLAQHRKRPRQLITVPVTVEDAEAQLARVQASQAQPLAIFVAIAERQLERAKTGTATRKIINPAYTAWEQGA